MTSSSSSAKPSAFQRLDFLVVFKAFEFFLEASSPEEALTGVPAAFLARREVPLGPDFAEIR